MTKERTAIPLARALGRYICLPGRIHTDLSSTGVCDLEPRSQARRRWGLELIEWNRKFVRRLREDDLGFRYRSEREQVMVG